MNNNLETLFQTTFQPDNTSQVEDWNVPSDRVWDSIEADLKKKKRRKVLFFVLLPCLFLATSAVIGATVYGLNNNEKSDKTTFALVAKANNDTAKSTASGSKLPTLDATKNDVNQTNIDTKSIKEDKGITKTVIKEANKTTTFVATTKQPRFVVDSKSFQKDVSKNLENNKKVTESKNQVVQSTATSFTNLSNNSAELASTVLDKNESKLSTNNENSKSEMLENLAKKEILSINTLTKNEALILNTTFPVFGIVKKANQYSRTSLIVMAQAFILKNKITSRDNIDFSGETINNAFNVGLGVQRDFSTKKLFLELGLQYTQINYKLDYDINLAFNPNGETQNTNGNFDNVYNGVFPTTQGPLQMKMVLQRQGGNNVIQGENIRITAKGAEKLTFLRIPFSVGAHFASQNRISFINKLSFNQLINVGSTTQFSEVLSYHSAIKETLTQVQLSPKPNVWTPEIGVSVGILAKLNRDIALGSELFYNKALLPMYKTNTYSNTPVNMGLNVYLKINIKK